MAAPNRRLDLQRFVTPKITVIPDRYAEVGFTTFGPIFNVRMAFTSERKDAIIDGFDLIVRHTDGDARTFRWYGLSETFSEIRDDAGNRQVAGRDQVPIALKIGTESLLEKLIRFQEPRYHDTVNPALSILVAQFNFLKNGGKQDYVSEILRSKELFQLNKIRSQSFWWKSGRYDVSIKLSSPRKFSLTRSDFAFELTSLDVDQLRRNLDTLETEMHNMIKSNLPDFQFQPINWNWPNVEITKVNHN